MGTDNIDPAQVRAELLVSAWVGAARVFLAGRRTSIMPNIGITNDR